MEVKVQHQGEHLCITVQGDIDEPGAEKLEDSFNHLDLSRVQEAVIDLKQVGHIGSAGIGRLLLLYKDLAVHGGDIRIVNVSGEVYDLLRIVKLDELMTISKA